MSIVELHQVEKHYRLGSVTVPALSGVDLIIEKDELTAVTGPPGSGKTTLLNLVGCVDVPSAGRVSIDGRATDTLDEPARTALRLHELGFMFPAFNLLGTLSVHQNVELPLLLQGRPGWLQRRRRVHEVADKVGLRRHLRQRPADLSGSQRQRVAIARALVTRPKIVLADEPTARLDTDAGNEILELIRALTESEATPFLLATHDPRVLGYARRILRLEDGRMTADEQPEPAGQASASAAEGGAERV